MHYAFEVTQHCQFHRHAPFYESHTSEHLSEALTEALTGLEVAEGQQHNPCYYRQWCVLSVLT